MKNYNPKRKHFVYSVQRTGIVPVGVLTPIRTNIHSDSWFDFRGIQGYIVFAAGGAPTLDLITINIYDEGTGRQLFSQAMSFDDIVPQLNDLAATRASLGMIPHTPFYIPTGLMLRPSTVLRTEIVNNNIGGTGNATVRLAYIGQKVFDLLQPYESPGTSFMPFTYVADFASTLLAATQLTVTVPIQSDYDFDVVKIVASTSLRASALDGVFMTMTDLRAGYSFEDAQIPIHLVTGAPHWPFLPIEPIRLQKATGINVTLNNTTGGTIANASVAFHGYKIVG